MSSVLPENSRLHSAPTSIMKWIFHEPTVQVSKQKVSPTLPMQKAYSVQVKKKEKLLVDILDDIPEAWTMLACKFAQTLKKKKPVVVHDKQTSKPVIPSMFFNPFRFKQGRRPEPKNVDQHAKKKDKDQRQPLALY